MQGDKPPDKDPRGGAPDEIPRGADDSRRGPRSDPDPREGLAELAWAIAAGAFLGTGTGFGLMLYSFHHPSEGLGIACVAMPVFVAAGFLPGVGPRQRLLLMMVGFGAGMSILPACARRMSAPAAAAVKNAALDQTVATVAGALLD